MNPFLNPVTALPFVKNLVFDPGRLRRWSPEKINRYRDLAFRKAVKYAYSVPLYHKKYKNANIHPRDIQGIKDITKLPFVSKKDLVNNYPNGILPLNYNKKNTAVVSTGGSTGKPVSIYTDFSVVSGGIGSFIRLMKDYNLNWRKSKLANIGNFNPGKPGDVGQKVLYSKARSLNLLGNCVFISVFNPIKDTINILNDFQPEMILAHPTTFQYLAHLKKKGYGKNLKPKILISHSCVLDKYIKTYAEDVFGCKIINAYGSVEASSEAIIAGECLEGIWHIYHDFYHVEVVNDNMELVDEGERGHIVVTRFFGKATPIVRYTGMDDWITLSYDYDCKCGLKTPIIKSGVSGRISSSIVTPDGTIYPAASFANIHTVLKKLNTQKVQQFQIVQKKIDEIDINIIIDEDLRDIGPSVDFLFEEIKKIHQEKTGSNVKINVIEVRDIPSGKNKPAALIVSKLTLEEKKKILKNYF